MLANQPKNDTLYIKGFNIVVENRAFTYRQVAQNVGQKACLMPAHYGYLQNNPKVGVFVGAFPENDTVYLINQKAQGGYFDKHIAMFGFLSEQQAVDTYQKCFEYGYIGLMSVVPCTIEQLKWWLANGDKSRPVTKERLPYAGLERLDSVLWGGEDKADLASHSGQVAKLLYQIRQSDNFNHALEPLSYHDLTQELGNQGFVYENYDALVIERNKLERKAKQMLMAMQGAADIVKPVGVAVSKPLTKGGVANVVAWFEMDDGQAVGVFFHNPDKTPKKLDPTDEMISYKWVLNKKDITIVVAPENGKDLVIRTVAKRIMKLVDANHDRFLKANSDKAELNLKEQNLGQLVIEKQAELDALNKAIELLEAQKAEREANKLKVPTGEELRQQGYNGVISELKKLGWTDDSVTGGLSKSFIGANEKGTINPDGILNVIVTAKDANMMATVGGDTIVSGSTVIIPQYGVTAQTEESYKKVANTINNAVEAYIDNRKANIQSDSQSKESNQERPADYRTNLANARAVAKSLGIETKGKKLADLVENIKLKDEANIIDAAIDDILTKLRLPVGFEAKKDSKHKMSYFTPVSLTNTETGEKLVIKILPSNSIAGYAATFSNESIKDDKALKAIDEYTGISQATIELLVEKLTGLINHELELNQPNAIQPENLNFGISFLQDALLKDKNKNKVFAFYLGDSDFVTLEERGKWELKVKGTRSHTTSVTKPFGQAVMANDDSKVFNSKDEAEQWALDNGYIVLQAERSGDTIKIHTLQPESEPLMKNQASGFIDDPKQKLGDEGKFNVPVNSSIVFESDKTGIYGEKVRVTKREFENAVTFDVELFEKDTNRWIEQKSYTDKDKAMIDAKGWEQGFNNSDRDYLQSIIDGKDTGLEPKAITAKIRQIVVDAKGKNDTEILVLADQAAKAYAAQVKAKAAAKLAEVQ